MLLGLSGRSALSVPATAMVWSAVAVFVRIGIGGFARRRSAALDLLRLPIPRNSFGSASTTASTRVAYSMAVALRRQRLDWLGRLIEQPLRALRLASRTRLSRSPASPAVWDQAARYENGTTRAIGTTILAMPARVVSIWGVPTQTLLTSGRSSSRMLRC